MSCTQAICSGKILTGWKHGQTKHLFQCLALLPGIIQFAFCCRVELDFLSFYRSVVVVRTLLQSRSQSRPNRPAPYSGTKVTNRTFKTNKIVTICKQVSLEPPQDRCTAWPDLKVQQDKNPLISPQKNQTPKHSSNVISVWATPQWRSQRPQPLSCSHIFYTAQ